MPYYQWTGIDIEGRTKKGKELASSSDELEKKLLHGHIALVAARPLRQRSWVLGRSFDTLDFFRQLHALLGSGIFTTEALAILVQQAGDGISVHILEALYNEVNKGISLSFALRAYSAYFDSLTIALLQAGEESGNVVHALEVLCNHIEFKRQFYQRLKAAAIVPAITLLFFLVIAVLIVAVIVPKFAVIFAEHNQPLPWITHVLMSGRLYHGMLASAFIGGGMMMWVRRQSYMQSIVLLLPFFSSLVRASNLTYFLKALSVLLRGGIALVPALKIAQHSISNLVIKGYVVDITNEVDKGQSFSEALKQSNLGATSHDLVTMIKVGEESGGLVTMIGHCADMYEKRVIKALNLFSALFQPTLMIILGLLIALLIMAVYVPVFELSQGISLV